MLRSYETIGVELTPELAAHWLSDLRYESNRRIRDLKIRRMSRVHLRDAFPETTAIHCTVRGQDNRNLDSQHRCEMVLSTQKPLFVRLSRFDATDEKQRREFWRTIDRGDARQYRDAVDADEWAEAGYHCKSEMEIIARLAEVIEGKLTATAVNSTLFSFEEKTDFACEWASRARILFDAMTDCPNVYRNLIRKKLVLAVLLPLFTDPDQQPAMIDLVRRIAHNENLQPKSAAQRLFLELQRSNFDLKGRPAVEAMRKLAYCCVRHLQGQNCQNIPNEIPVALPGTDIVVG